MTVSGMPQIGDVIAGRYKLLDELGKGGFGVVFRAHQDRIPNEVALKVLYYEQSSVSGAMDSEEFQKRFRREAVMASSLNHPHVVQQIDFGVDGNLYYLAMELITGENLKERIARTGALSTELVARIGYAALDVLHLAHQKDIVHRDLKPENIMLCDVDGHQDFPKILDFGAAKTMHGQHDLTAQGLTLGSPAYMSPEILMDEDPQPASDLYSLGLTLGEAILGERVVQGKTPIECLKLQISPHPLNIPLELIKHPLFPWLGRALEKDKTQRYRSAREMKQALEQLNLPGVTLQFKDLSGEDGGAPTAALPAIQGPGTQTTADATELVDLNSDLPDGMSLDDILGQQAGADATELVDLNAELPEGTSLDDILGGGDAHTEMIDVSGEFPGVQRPDRFSGGGDAHTEMIDLSGEFPAASRADIPDEEGSSATEMIDLNAGGSNLLSQESMELRRRQQQQQQQQQPSIPSPSASSSDDFYRAKTAALPAVGSHHEPQQPSPQSSQEFAAARSSQEFPASSQGQGQWQAPAQGQGQWQAPAEVEHEESEIFEFDPNEYAAFSSRRQQQERRPATEIIELVPTEETDFMTVRTSHKRNTSVYMPALLVGAVLLIFAVFIVHAIAF